jgi:hypothetical protein
MCIFYNKFNILQKKLRCTPVLRNNHNPQNPDFVNSAVIENAWQSEGDSKVAILARKGGITFVHRARDAGLS